MTRARDVADTQENLGGGVPPFVAGKNKIINGDFGIWQRGTTFNPSATGFFMFADRFRSYTYAASATTASQQAFSPGTAPVAGYEGTYFGRVVSTNTSAYFSYNGIENVRNFAGQTVTLSYWAKSASAQTLNEVQISQYFGSTGSAAVATTLTAPAITTSWARYTHTFTMPSISGKTISGGNDGIFINIKGAINNALDMWGFQLEAGNVATPFTTATGTIQGELAACQRYYQIITAGAVTATNSTTRVAFSTVFPPMRTTTPTFSLTGPLVITDLFTANFTQSASEITTNINNGNNGATLSFNNFSGLTAYRGYQITGAQQILASAEL